jgi:acetyltransferase-like isoleucine patch superfamily enzyme
LRRPSPRAVSEETGGRWRAEAPGSGMCHLCRTAEGLARLLPWHDMVSIALQHGLARGRGLLYRLLSDNEITGTALVHTAVLAQGRGEIRLDGAHLGWPSAPRWLDSHVLLDARTQGASITIGRGSVIGNASVLVAEGPGIAIGERVVTGHELTVYDSDFHDIDPAHRMDGTPGQRARVVIEDDVFLGSRVTVLKGVTIGRCTVVGAGALVTTSLPPGVVAAGNPCAVIRRLQPPRTVS